MDYTMVRAHCTKQLRYVHFTECKLYFIIKKKRENRRGKMRKDVVVASQHAFYPR